MIDVKAKFEEAKEMEVFILENQVKIARRVDTYAKCQDNYFNFYGKRATHEQTLKMIDYLAATAEKMLEIVKGYCYEQFAVEPEEFVDPFAELIKSVDDCKDKAEVFEALNIWAMVRPYGERAERLNATVIESLDKNAAEAKGELTDGDNAED